MSIEEVCCYCGETITDENQLNSHSGFYYCNSCYDSLINNVDDEENED